MGSSTVHTIFMARPSEEEMELFWKLYNAAQRVEDRWHHNTVGLIADELSHCPNLTRQEKMLLLRAWQVLVDGIGGFGRFMGSFDTYVHNMQDPGVGHVAYKPSLIEMFGNAELLPVVIEAYQDALTALEEKDKTLALVREQRDNELRTNTELERANSAQDDHINQQQDRIDTLERKNDELGKHAGKLEQQLQQPVLPDDYFSTLVNAARLAADKAMRKHPQPNYVLLKVAEEAGEVVQAGVHYAEGRMTWQDLEGEIVQLLAMLIRLVTEGDQVNGIKPPASCSTATLAAVPDEIDIFVDQVCGNLPAGHQQ